MLVEAAKPADRSKTNITKGLGVKQFIQDCSKTIIVIGC